MNRAVTPALPIAIEVPDFLTVIVHPDIDARGISASIPALPACLTQGKNLNEVCANLRDAAEGWLVVAHKDGLARDPVGHPRLQGTII